jgi:hypothetical protein
VVGGAWAIGGLQTTSPNPLTAAISGQLADLHQPANADGWKWASQVLPSGFTLAGQGDTVVWAANLAGRSFDNSGLRALGGNAECDPALWLGGTSADLSTGDGYIAALTFLYDPVETLRAARLIRYTGGVEGSLTVLLSDGVDHAAADDVNLKVTYDPGTDTWELFSSEGGWLADPTTLGASESAGTVVDDTYAASVLVASGIAHHGFAGGGASGRDGEFDNLSMNVIPEPATLGLMVLGAMGLLLRRRVC